MISQKQVQHIAKLARLDFSDQELNAIQKDLAVILDYFNALQELDVKDVDPLFYPVPLENVMREDEAKPENPEIVEQMLLQAPEKHNLQIKVKEVL